MAGGRKEFSGGAQDLTLATALSATGLTIVVSGDLTTWPTGVHPFVIDIDETEKVLVTSRSGSVMTVASTSDRGYDNTTGVSHLVGAVVRHVLDAGTVEEANAHVNDDTRDDHCFSEDTEILTERGWLGVDEIEVGDHAWTFRLEDGRAELEPIKHVWAYGADHASELVSLCNQDSGEILVTPEHSMVWRRARTKNQSEWSRRTAASLPQQFSIPASAVGHEGSLDLSDEHVALLAWVATEGYLFPDGRINVSQAAGALSNRIRGLLDRLGIGYGHYKQSYKDGRKDMESFVFRSGFISWALDEEKVPRLELMGMSDRQARIFIGESVLGDGHVSGGNKEERVVAWLAGGPQPTMFLASATHRFLDFTQALCVLSGIKSRAYYEADGFGRLAIKSSQEHSFTKGTVARVANEGRVWCVTVPVNSTVIARRPGSAPFISSNSQYLNTTRHDVTARHALGVSIATGTPGSSAVGDAAAAGVSGSAARADHRHAREGFGTPGSSAVGDTATAGTATTVARSDHKHGREGFGSPVASAIGDSAADGTATTLARSDHKHAREAAGTPGTSSPGDTASAGSATTVAKSDHRHAREAAPGISQNSTGNAADQGMAAGDEITMASQAISPTATRLIQVSGAFQVRAVTPGNSFAGYLRLKLDGTNMTGGEIRFNNHSLTDLVNVSWAAWAQVAAGSHTITLVGTNDITSGTTVYCDARILNVNQIGG